MRRTHGALPALSVRGRPWARNALRTRSKHLQKSIPPSAPMKLSAGRFDTWSPTLKRFRTLPATSFRHGVGALQDPQGHCHAERVQRVGLGDIVPLDEGGVCPLPEER